MGDRIRPWVQSYTELNSVAVRMETSRDSTSTVVIHIRGRRWLPSTVEGKSPIRTHFTHRRSSAGLASALKPVAGDRNR
jgi:hypothetical protein